jgi:hypothetical protein
LRSRVYSLAHDLPIKSSHEGAYRDAGDMIDGYAGLDASLDDADVSAASSSAAAEDEADGVAGQHSA